MPDRLPLSVDALDRSIENTNNYLVRSLPRVVANLQKKGRKNITFESIASYVPSFQKCDKITKSEIKSLLKKEYIFNV